MSDITAARRQQDEKDAPELLAELDQLQKELTQELDALRPSDKTYPQIAVIEDHLTILEDTEAQLRGQLRSARQTLAHLRQKRERRGRA